MMGAPIRVAHIMGKMNGGGVESVVMNYQRHIDPERVAFDFVIDTDSTQVPRGEIEAAGGRVIEVPPYQRLPQYLSALEALFRREGYKIVHSHINALSVFPLYAAKRAGVPVRIAHSHSTAGKGELKKNLLKYILRTQANRYPTHRIACSRYAGDWMFGKGADFEVLFNAIELDKFAFDHKAREETRLGLNLVDGQLAVGHVGRFIPQKNHPFLLETFSKLLETQTDAVLLLAGDGKDRTSVERWASEHGIANRVRFLGQRDDIDRLYQAFDVFVLPSLYEGLGIVAVEAQRAGLPCVLSDRITREVDLTGNVRFLPTTDSHAWAGAIAVAFEAGRRVIDSRCFDNYDITRASGKLVAYYERALEVSIR